MLGSKKIILSLIMAVCLLQAFGYGLDLAKTDAASAELSYAVPENGFMIRMRQPDGTVRRLFRDPEDYASLYGDTPWVGDVRGSVTRVLTNPQANTERTAFLFRAGRLVKLGVGNQVWSYTPSPLPPILADVKTLWPAELDEERLKADYYTWSKDNKRLKFGFSNPNKAAGFIAEIALVAFALVLLRRRLPVVVGSLILAASLVALFLTGSRGGLIAVAVGFAACIGFELKSFLHGRRAVIGAVILGVLAVSTLVLLRGDRFKGNFINLNNQSDADRAEIVAAVPAMVADAPQGWGAGNSGEAFNYWYQKVGHNRVFRTIVSSHLTKLVELSNVGRFGYVFSWSFGLLLLAAFAFRGGSRLPLALWLALFTASAFNAVLQGVELWIIPLFSLFLVFNGWKGRFRRWDGVFCCVLSLVVSSLVLGGVVWIGKSKVGNRVPILGENTTVVVGKGKPQTWVVPDIAILGGRLFGKDVRHFYQEHPDANAVGFASEVADLPRSTSRLVLVGRSGEDFLTRWKTGSIDLPALSGVLFISPSFHVDEIPQKLLEKYQVGVVVGEFAARMGGGIKQSGPWVMKIPGCELYIPNWLSFVSLNRR